MTPNVGRHDFPESVLLHGAGAHAVILNDDEHLDPDQGPAPYPVGDQLGDEHYVQYSKALLTERREYMEPLFIQWTQNLLFLAGLQWWTYDSAMGTFGPLRAPKWKERPVRNLLLPYFKFVLAKLTKNRPRSSCVPASTDPDDLQSGELGDDVLKAKWQELRMTKVMRRAAAWLISTGNGFVLPYWNTESGILQPLTTLVEALEIDRDTGMQKPTVMECPCDENGDPLQDEEGNYDIEAEPAFVDIGEVGHRVLSPFQCMPDVGVSCDDDVHSWIIVEAHPVRDIVRRWPELKGLVVGEDTSEVDSYESLISGITSGADTHMAGAHFEQDDQKVQKAVIIHYYEKPTRPNPMGRHWVNVGQYLPERPGPLPDGIWPPVVHLKDVEVPGRYHAEATMTAAVGINREYNEVNAQIKEHHNLLLRGKWLVPLGSNIRRGQITAAPGEVIQHTPGLPPVMADLKPLPQKVYDEREQLLADFQYITGVHKASMGDPPPGVTSGRAFLTLQEADDSDLGPLTEMWEEAVALLGWLTLQIIQRYYEEERLIHVSGENRRFLVRSFKGADLSSIVDVEPQVGSAFPWSKTAKQSMMIELVQAIPELFTDAETGMFDHERFRRALPIGGEEAVGLAGDLDISEALREEEKFETWDGLMPLPIVQPWQNHAIHLRQHGRILKGASFERWDPLLQAAFVAHWIETSAAVQAQLAARMALEAGPDEEGGKSSKGGAPGGGGGPKADQQPQLTDNEAAMAGA